MKFTEKDSLLIANCIFFGTISFLASREHINSSVLPSISNEITELSGTTIDRTFKLWGATGVITKLAESGNKIGPLQLIL